MELLNKEDYKTVLEEHEVLFVVFYATWCPPCRMLRPILEEYMENNPNVEVNNDEVVHKSSNLAEIDNIQQMRDEKNNEYLEILETNPDSLFDEVTKELISKWKIMLYSSLQIEDFVPLPEIHKLEDIKYSKIVFARSSRRFYFCVHRSRNFR